MKKSSQKIDLAEYNGLVVNIAAKYAKKSCAQNDYHAELVGAGWDGAIDAQERYNATIGPFSAYVGHRIKGSILDKLRDLDRYSRRTRQWINKIERAMSVIESRNMESAKDYEIANELGIALDRYNKILFRIYNSTCFSIDEYLNLENNDTSKAETFHKIHFANDPNLDDEICKKEMEMLLAKIISTLSEREQLIVDLYYYEDFTLKEIGNKFDLSESRICQIHKKILKKLLVCLKSELATG